MTDPRDALPLQVEDPALVPTRAHALDAGYDLKSADDLTIPAGQRALVPTGVRLALSEGTVGLVCPRSGLAAKHGITVLNAPGVVDAGYRGEIKVALVNTDPNDAFTISRGDRIAQLLITPILTPEVEIVDELESAERGDRGFGSSGGFTSTVRKA